MKQPTRKRARKIHRQRMRNIAKSKTSIFTK